MIKSTMSAFLSSDKQTMHFCIAQGSPQTERHAFRDTSKLKDKALTRWTRMTTFKHIPARLVAGETGADLVHGVSG